MAEWHVVRYIKEEFFIEAETREEALEHMWEQGDPPKVTCQRQTCKKRNRNSPHRHRQGETNRLKNS